LITISDILSLASGISAIAALCIAIDSIYVIRLTSQRDMILEKCLRGLKDHKYLKTDTRKTETEKQLALESLEKLKSIADELESTDFFQDLSSIIFFRGSIVRALIIAMAANIFLTAISIFKITGTPYLSQWANMFSFLSQIDCVAIGAGCAPQLDGVAITMGGVMIFILTCMIRYLFLWKSQQSALITFQNTVSNEVNRLDIFPQDVSG
jgi:hypothetical protein